MTPNPSLSAIRREIERITSLGYREIASSLPRDRVPIGFFCPYVPEELLHAADAHPFRLMGSPLQITLAKNHLPPYCCHLVKSSLESLLRGELSFLKGVVFSHTCDAMQGLSDIWSRQQGSSFHIDLMVPSHFGSEHACAYFNEEVQRLKTSLESRLGTISPDNLRNSIHLFNRIRDRLNDLYFVRGISPGHLPGDYFARIIRAGYLMDRSRYLDLLTELLKGLPREEEQPEDLIPIYLAGNMTHSDYHFSLIEEAGARVVRDNLCSGARFTRLMVPEESDPMDGLVQRYATSFFCPTKHHGVLAHAEALLGEVESSGAKGALFLLYKYCEPHFFDYPDLKAALESRGTPTLLLEVEDPYQSREQLKTRIQAFVEMLSPL